jgi:hypothetical protein
VDGSVFVEIRPGATIQSIPPSLLSVAGAGRAVVRCRFLIGPIEFKFDRLNTNSII